MKTVFSLVLLLLPFPAYADLYRWVDPESGSVKLSSSPPPWYETGKGPAVERVPYAVPASKPAAEVSPKPASQMLPRQTPEKKK